MYCGRKGYLVVLLLFMFFAKAPVAAQIEPNDKAYVELAAALIDRALAEGRAYAMLRELCFDVGGRLSGSPQAAAAVEWARQKMIAAGLDSVFLQEVMVPVWKRGAIEKARVVGSPSQGDVELDVCALGGSVATPPLGITAEVREVQTFEALKAMGKAAGGKIIFFNRPMDPRARSLFAAYGAAVEQRSMGAVEAARAGAVAVLVRSMTTAIDDVPHTGAMRYVDGVKKIPAAAISTQDADFLSELLQTGESVRVNLRLSCQTLDDVPSANVIGELRGSEIPEEAVLIGGHLDSWDKGQGAHDDGAGCVQAIEALRLLHDMGLQPRRTIRAVLFMNEENGLRGGRKYAEQVGRSGPKHIAAIESDRGGFAPRGLTVRAEMEIVERIGRWRYLFEPIGADRIIRGGGGADISPLLPHGVITMGLLVDDNRYFDYHHSNNDTFDKVNKRELELGAAVLAIMAYVLANEGI